MVAACPFPANYGSPAAIKEMSEAMADLGYDIHIVTYPYGDEIPVRKARIHRISGFGVSHQVSVGPALHKPVLDLLMVFKACHVIWKYKCDIIHAHNYEGQLVGMCTKLITGRPLLYNAVNSMTDELSSYNFIKPAFVARWLAAFLDWFVPKFSDQILTLTQELLELLAAKGTPRERMVCIPAGIRPEMFQHANPDRFREALQLRDKRVVLYTGTLDRFQRLDIFFRAFARLGPEFSDTVLLLVSPFTQNALRRELEALSGELGIANRLCWIDQHPLEDLPDYLVLGDVAVVPRPHSSGQPIKLLNYMATARPIVAAAGGAKGIRHLHDGFICRDEDVDHMAEGLSLLLTDRKLAERLGAAALDTVREEYDWRILCRKIESIYLGIILARQTGVQSIVGKAREDHA
jgi:glycosyltransferase involved in cell wall biosynthesis